MKLSVALVSLVIFGACATKDDGIANVYPDLNDPNVLYAVYAINTMMSTHEDTRIALRIVSATAQVARGVIYRFQIEVTNGANNEICDVTVINRPWMSSGDAHTFETGHCSPARKAPDSNNKTMSSMSSPSPTAVPDQDDRYRNETHSSLSDNARRALIFFVDRINALKSSLPRLIPYDVQVKAKRYYGQTTFRFSLRWIGSKCKVTDPTTWGKITLKECPPLKDLKYTGPKTQIAVRWDPSDLDKTYRILK